jgi:hypothetical protein
MQTTTQIKLVPVVKTSMNPFSHETRDIEERHAKAEAEATTRFSKLDPMLQALINDVFEQAETERDIVALLDGSFNGNIVIGKDKSGNTYSWKGYPKIVDIAIAEYKSRLATAH